MYSITQLNLLGIFMKKISTLILLAILTVTIWTSPAIAYTGNDLLADCESKNAHKSDRCLSYIAGVVDAHIIMVARKEVSSLFCADWNVTYPQYRRVVLKFLKTNHTVLQVIASDLVLSSLRNNFPCPKEP